MISLCCIIYVAVFSGSTMNCEYHPIDKASSEAYEYRDFGIEQ